MTILRQGNFSAPDAAPSAQACAVTPAVAPITAPPEGTRFRRNGYVAEAGWFGPEPRPRFGWLYRPDQPTCNTGIVLVPPFGTEAICAHCTLRHLAEDGARAGCVAVRFDLDGTGDSAGSDTDPDRIAAWIASINDACDLARTAGAERLALVGIRTGATLASLAASGRKDVAVLIAINAIVRGRDFLREAHALQSAMRLRPPPDPPPDDGSQEVNGFVITAETRAQLGAIDLAQCTQPPAPVVLLIERDDMPERKHWPHQLRNLGVDVAVQRLHGLVEMLDLPHLAIVPQAAITACIEHARRPMAHAETAAATPRPMVTLRRDARIHIDDSIVIEEAVRIDTELFGIVARPVSGTPTLGAVLLNAGAVSHIGPGRIYVEWARRWAALGNRVLRADHSGIGDSEARAGVRENRVYGRHGATDAACLAAWLRGQDTERVIAAGACSGAYYALRAAITGDAIDSIVLINPGALCDVGTIENRPAPPIKDRRLHKSERGEAWRKLVSGKVSPRKFTQKTAHYLSTYAGMFGRECLRSVHWPMHNDLGTELKALASRGIDMHFVFSTNDHSQTLLARYGGLAARRLIRQGRIHVRTIDGPDHTFTQRWAQAKLHEALRTVLAPLVRHGP